MVLWQGLTEGGTAVPVQVTEAGKVVAEGQQGQEGPPGPPGEQGPQGPQGEYGPGDDVVFGSIKAAEPIRTGDSVETDTSAFAVLDPSGQVVLQNKEGDNTKNVLLVFNQSYVAGQEKLKIDAGGNIIAKGKIAAAGSIIAGKNGVSSPDEYFRWQPTGGITVNNPTGTSTIFQGNDGSSVDFTSKIFANGSATFSGNKAGFTADGEVYFTSRGTRYKLEVAGGLCNAIPFTREMELREKVEDKRKPRPTDSVPED